MLLFFKQKAANERRISDWSSDLCSSDLAPAVARFPGRDLVATGDQVRQHAAQEMGVAVVPARLQRMGEIDELHAATSGSSVASGRPRYAPILLSAIAGPV